MLTRSKSKLQQQAGLVEIADEPKQPVKKKSGRSVRLTEDLLYIVNKKLRTMDKASRDETIHDFYSYGGFVPFTEPFAEISYRKRFFPDLSETELAVMHKTNFDCNSMALCEINSMGQFFESLNKGSWRAKPLDYRRFLGYDTTDAGAPVKNAVARFIQLPKDYFRPQSDVVFFAELAWKENGTMIVEADNFALCLTIWRLKEWLVNPIKNPYPLPCQWIERGIGCCCRNLLRAMWTDDRLRKVLQDQAFFAFGYYDKRRNYEQLQEARGRIQDYAEKLITGEEIISRSNRALNLLSASQLLRIHKEFESILRCTLEDEDSDDWW